MAYGPNKINGSTIKTMSFCLFYDVRHYEISLHNKHFGYRPQSYLEEKINTRTEYAVATIIFIARHTSREHLRTEAVGTEAFTMAQIERLSSAAK